MRYFNKLIFILVVLVIMLPVAFSATIFQKNEVHSPECFSDGSFSFMVSKYLIEQGWATDDNSYLKINNVTLTIKDEYGNEIFLKHMSSLDSIFKIESINYYDNLKSTPGIINRSGDYTLDLIMDVFPYKVYTRSVNFKKCPGFSYTCSLLNWSIDGCYNYGDNLYVEFSGLNKNQYIELNPVTDVLFDLYGSRKTMGKINAPIGSTFQTLDNNIIAVTIPTYEFGKVSKLFAVPKVCKDYYDKIKLKSCSDKIDCNYDSDCLSIQKCNRETHMCQLLKCSSCQIVKDHRCAAKCMSDDPCKVASCESGTCKYNRVNSCCLKNSDCDDNLICTLDDCNEGSCNHSPLACNKFSGSGVSPSCVEPDGCRYELLDNGITGQVIGVNKGNNGNVKISINWQGLLIVVLIVSVGYLGYDKFYGRKKIKKKN